MKNKGRYRGPGYVQCITQYYFKNRKLKQRKFYLLLKGPK